MSVLFYHENFLREVTGLRESAAIYKGISG